MDTRLKALENAVRGAARIALDLYGRAEIERKPDRSVVTEADRKVERHLVEHVRRIEPDARVLCEEKTTPATTPGDAPTWAIDPIDGTAMFVSGVPTWAISVGLIHDNQPELGCVYLPVADQMFLASADGPLFLNGETVSEEAGSEQTQPDFGRDDWLAVPSNQHRRYKCSFPGCTRSFGSTAAHFAWAASGAATGAVAFARLWDVAGGLACCRASGREASYLSGAPLDYAALLSGASTPEPIVVARAQDMQAIRDSFELIPRKLSDR